MAATDGNTEQQDFRNADLKESDDASSAGGSQTLGKAFSR